MLWIQHSANAISFVSLSTSWMKLTYEFRFTCTTWRLHDRVEILEITLRDIRFYVLNYKIALSSIYWTSFAAYENNKIICVSVFQNTLMSFAKPIPDHEYHWSLISYFRTVSCCAFHTMNLGLIVILTIATLIHNSNSYVDLDFDLGEERYIHTFIL